jgi:hypothetical protein
VAIAILGAAVNITRVAVIGSVLGPARGPIGAETLRLTRGRPIPLYYATRVDIALGIVWLMTLKPDFFPSVIVLVVAAGGGAVVAGFLASRPSTDVDEEAKTKASLGTRLPPG